MVGVSRATTQWRYTLNKAPDCPTIGVHLTVPRHREINEFMAKKICRELEIDEPGKEKKPAKGEQSDTADS